MLCDRSRAEPEPADLPLELKSQTAKQKSFIHFCFDGITMPIVARANELDWETATHLHLAGD
jgi:hypothetical protein